jgi:lipid-A-disaccharide synthase
VKTMRKVIDRLLCIFPFERAFFETHSVPVAYIGHPLAGRIKPGISREEFFRKHKIALDRPLVAVLPGSRKGEALRHLPALKDAAVALSKDRKLSFILPASPACGAAFFLIPLADSPIRAIDGEAWEAMAFCDVALAASGTVTVEAALLGTPMVTFYKVTDLSWKLGKYLVKVPFYTMVNLVAGRKVVPELMQAEMTGERLALETARLLDSEEERGKMKKDLAEVAGSLSLAGDAMARAADEVARLLGVPVLEGSKS